MNAAIILAAGASTRLGRAKQLVELDGVPLVERAVRVAREAALVPYVVVGASARTVSEVLSDAVVVPNEDWELGMGSSIAMGIARAAGDGARTVTILPCDLPFVTARELRQLLEAYPGFDASAAEYDGRLGAPACFPYDSLAALQRSLRERPHEGARHFLRHGDRRVASVPMDVASVDVDSVEDLERLGLA